MKSFKIGFDAKRAVLNYTGLGNYSRLAIDAVSTKLPDNEYFLYTPKVKANDRLIDLLGRDNITLRCPD